MAGYIGCNALNAFGGVNFPSPPSPRLRTKVAWGARIMKSAPPCVVYLKLGPGLVRDVDVCGGSARGVSSMAETFHPGSDSARQ